MKQSIRSQALPLSSSPAPIPEPTFALTVEIMSTATHATFSHPVSCDPKVSSPAPQEEGIRAGYFDDSLTRDLLWIESDNGLLHAGPYGSQEPGQSHTPISLLIGGSYDQRILPFIPSKRQYPSLEFHLQNRQWLVRIRAVKGLKETLRMTIIEAQKAGAAAALGLPNYARVLIPKFQYHHQSDGENLTYQFLPFFSCSASRARWVRICRVITFLHGYIHLCRKLINPGAPWDFGEPVGVACDVNDENSRNLVRAYKFLGLRAVGGAPFEVPEEYTIEMARDAIVGSKLGKDPVILTFPEPEETLAGTNDDALVFGAVCPDHDPNAFDEDGRRTTRGQRQQLRELQEEHEFSMEQERRPEPQEAEARIVVTRPVETLSDPPSRTDLQGGTTEFADALRLTLGLQGEQPSSLHAWGADSPTEFHATLTPVSVSTSASASGLSSGYSSSSSRLAPCMGTGDSLSRSGQSSRSRYDYREPGRGQPSASSERARPFRTRPSSYRPRSPPPRSRSPLPSPHSRSLYSSHRRPHSRSPSPRRPSSPPRRSQMPSPPRRYPSPARCPRSPPAARRSCSPPPMIRRPRSPSPRRFRQPSPVSRRGELSDSLALVRRDVGAPPSMLVPKQH